MTSNAALGEGEMRELSTAEWTALLERIHLARAFDRRGPNVRIGTYAERMNLIPRLVATIALRDAEAARLLQEVYESHAVILNAPGEGLVSVPGEPERECDCADCARYRAALAPREAGAGGEKG